MGAKRAKKALAQARRRTTVWRSVGEKSDEGRDDPAEVLPRKGIEGSDLEDVMAEEQRRGAPEHCSCATRCTMLDEPFDRNEHRDPREPS